MKLFNVVSSGERRDIWGANCWERADPVESRVAPLVSSLTGWETISQNCHSTSSHICSLDFFHTLPRPGIKKHLTPILAGLLEVNPQKMWTFEKFFNEVRRTRTTLPIIVAKSLTWTLGHQVTNLLGKKKVYVYYMNKLSQLRVYLDRSQVSLWFSIYTHPISDFHNSSPASGTSPTSTHRADWRGAWQSDSSSQCNLFIII